jgi:hypothetical protein
MKFSKWQNLLTAPGAGFCQGFDEGYSARHLPDPYPAAMDRPEGG